MKIKTTYGEMAKFTERLIAAILRAPKKIRHHLAAVSWWRIVGFAEQQDSGARLKLRNAIEAVYTDARWTQGEIEAKILKAVVHYATCSVQSFMLTHAASPLREMFRLGDFGKFDAKKVGEYVESMQCGYDIKEFLRDSIFKDIEARNNADALVADGVRPDGAESIVEHAFLAAVEKQKDADKDGGDKEDNA